MRSFAVELLDKGIELGLLLQKVSASRPSGFVFQRQMHALMAAILLGMTGTNAFDADAQAQPPHRQFRKIEESVGGSKGHAVVGTNRLGQTAFPEQSFKGQEGWPRTTANSARHNRSPLTDNSSACCPAETRPCSRYTTSHSGSAQQRAAFPGRVSWSGRPLPPDHVDP